MGHSMYTVMVELFSTPTREKAYAFLEWARARGNLTVHVLEEDSDDRDSL